MPADKREAHLNALRALCDQAEKLRQVAAALCERLTKRMEATKASVHLAHKLPATERRRKIRNRL